MFVGRDRELGLLLSTVARAPADGLVAVVVAGEAGIGKSRLLVEVGRLLGAKRHRVLAVRADRLERQVPYGALATALRAIPSENAYTDGLRRDALTAVDISLVPAADPPFARAWAALTRLCTALAAASPLVLLVDDLHELDDDSLALLAVVLRRLSAAPVALVAAVRTHRAAPGGPVDELLERLPDPVRLDLGTLSAAELAEMITPILGAAPAGDVATRLHARADGNPFFAAELARSLAETGDQRLTRGDAVLRRVLPLGADARAVARTLAVLQSVALDRFDLVAEVAGRPPAAVAAAFDGLVRANVVALREDRYRFTHDLVADAVYDDIGPAECRRLHGLVAARLLAARAAGYPVDLLELAWHVAESAAPGDAVAVEVLTDAARLALASAPEAAANFCAGALALGPAKPARGALLALRCRALARASRPAAAVPAGEAALDLLPPGEDRVRTATAVVASLISLGRIADAVDVVDAQIKVGPVPAALHAQRALLLVFVGRTAEARDELAAVAARELTTPAERVVVNGQLAMVTSMLARHGDTLAYADRALDGSGTSTTLRLQALAVGAVTLSLAGFVPETASRLRHAAQLADDAPYAYPGELGLSRVVLDWLGGRWDAALEALPRVSADLAARQLEPLVHALTAVELDIRTWRGELVVAARLAAGPTPPTVNMANLHLVGVAGYLLATGDLDAARRLLTEAAGGDDSTPYWSLIMGRLAEVELAAGRMEAAAVAAARLVAVETPRVLPWSKANVYRVDGTVRGDADALRRAVAAAADGGLVFEQARAQLALAGLVPDAVPELLAAHATFARLGVHPLRRRAANRLAELGEKVPRARSRPAGALTESEERVARLVQQGMRNREIATALHYSPRSIEVYLSRIYAKLRVSSRLELARALDALDAS